MTFSTRTLTVASFGSLPTRYCRPRQDASSFWNSGWCRMALTWSLSSASIRAMSRQSRRCHLGLGRDLGGAGEAQPSAQGAPGRRFGEEPVERRPVALAAPVVARRTSSSSPAGSSTVLGRGGRPVAVARPEVVPPARRRATARRPRDGGIPRQSTPVRRRAGPSPRGLRLAIPARAAQTGARPRIRTSWGCSPPSAARRSAPRTGATAAGRRPRCRSPGLPGISLTSTLASRQRVLGLHLLAGVRRWR